LQLAQSATISPGLLERPTVELNRPAERAGSSVNTRFKLDKAGKIAQAANDVRLRKE
jgi:hypothetical protein